MESYVGVRIVKAEVEVRTGTDGNEMEGYKVVFGDGQEGWYPKEEFEKFYFRLADDSKVSDVDISRFMEGSKVNVESRNGKTTLLMIEYPTGWLEYEASSCVDPKNYDPKLGTNLCVERVSKRLWNYLGFILQWAVKGLK